MNFGFTKEQVNSMKAIQSLFVAVVGLCVGMPALAQSTTCTPQVNCTLTVAQNLAVDSGFEVGCPAWKFDGTGSTREAAGPCSTTYCPKADALMKASSTSTATYFQQDINLAPTGCRLTPFRLTFYIHVRSTSASTWDQATVEVLDPATGTLLQTVAVYNAFTQRNWEYQELPLSSSSTSVWPQWVRLRIRGTFATSSSPAQFRFDDIRFMGI
jgi:hypothetical protein